MFGNIFSSCDSEVPLPDREVSIDNPWGGLQGLHQPALLKGEGELSGESSRTAEINGCSSKQACNYQLTSKSYEHGVGLVILLAGVGFYKSLSSCEPTCCCCCGPSSSSTMF